MTHTITWDHTDCEHDDEHSAAAENWCYPDGTITCTDLTGDCRRHCRTSVYTGCEDGWQYCRNECEGYGHVDPGVPHCTSGHVLDLGECNAILYIDYDVKGCGPVESLPFTDGPIEVEWTGDGYVWTYLDTVPHDAVG
jgi:hypothetical protein